MSFEFNDEFEELNLYGTTKMNDNEGEEEMVSDLLEKSENFEHNYIYENIKNNKGIKSILRDLIEELPADEKQVIYMKFWESRTDDEIGYELGARTSTVRKMLRNAFDYLRERIVTEVYSNNDLLASA